VASGKYFSKFSIKKNLLHTGRYPRFCGNCQELFVIHLVYWAVMVGFTLGTLSTIFVGLLGLSSGILSAQPVIELSTTEPDEALGLRVSYY
jgi:hypothetical protein